MSSTQVLQHSSSTDSPNKRCGVICHQYNLGEQAINMAVTSIPAAVELTCPLFLQFDEDIDDETKTKKPFYLKFKFYRNTFLFVTR